jgi:hypothetical protein
VAVLQPTAPTESKQAEDGEQQKPDSRHDRFFP